MTPNGSDAVVRTLLDCGCSVMFANPGTTEMPVVEAVDRAGGGMRAVLGLHENVVTGAADGYARMSGKPACTLLHLGPGLANGLANLHNARRAGAPVVNIIGEMATWHREADALLSMDIEALAATVSTCVRTPESAEEVATETARCIAATREFRAGASRVATLVLPHDCERDSCGEHVSVAVPPPSAEGEGFQLAAGVDREVHGAAGGLEAAVQAADALRQHGVSACLFVGGPAATRPGLLEAGRIAAATGAELFCENAFPRVDRGEGVPPLHRLAYFPTDAKKELTKFKVIVFVGARVPVAMFGYADGVSEIVEPKQQALICVDTHDPVGALRHVAGILSAPPTPPSKPVSRPSRPAGKLNPHKLSQAIACVQPEGAIIVDESLTSGGAYWNFSQGCPSFTHLTLTGGSIGQGPPLAVGCAVACPERRVINFQADGSGMYTLQALWTQARERLRVTTVICNNSTYQILKIEQQKQTLDQRGPAARALTDIAAPAINWVSLATGLGVPAEKARTGEELLALLEKGLG
eukprot:Hpha_TRINITY_DN16535_c0_g2::TRINITY_DN16535_c0_g2_i1::g.135194::m.135194/K01652/E2.2.1.6L, ilvB, ilvG, ilvI; acetolactate synthase I/II/III large subunit